MTKREKGLQWGALPGVYTEYWEILLIISFSHLIRSFNLQMSSQHGRGVDTFFGACKTSILGNLHEQHQLRWWWFSIQGIDEIACRWALACAVISNRVLSIHHYNSWNIVPTVMQKLPRFLVCARHPLAPPPAATLHNKHVADRQGVECMCNERMKVLLPIIICLPRLSITQCTTVMNYCMLIELWYFNSPSDAVFAPPKMQHPQNNTRGGARRASVILFNLCMKCR